MNKELFVLGALISIISLLLNYQTAFAHIDITVGDYEFVISWVEETPIVGQKNAILVNVVNTNNPPFPIRLAGIS